MVFMLLSSQWFPASNFTTISSNIFEELFHLSATLLAKFISVTARFSMKASLYFNSIHIRIIKFDNNQKFHKFSEPQRLKFQIFVNNFICHPEVASSCILEYNCQIPSRCMQFLTNWITYKTLLYTNLFTLFCHTRTQNNEMLHKSEAKGFKLETYRESQHYIVVHN
jgi:hypothetical protein